MWLRYIRINPDYILNYQTTYIRFSSFMVSLWIVLGYKWIWLLLYQEFRSARLYSVCCKVSSFITGNTECTCIQHWQSIINVEISDSWITRIADYGLRSLLVVHIRCCQACWSLWCCIKSNSTWPSCDTVTNLPDWPSYSWYWTVTRLT